MKKFTAVCLAAILLLSICACAREDENPVWPVNFYYPRVEPAFGTADSLIAAEVREADGYAGNMKYLLELYLCGPLDVHFTTPFPTGTTLSSLEILEDSLVVTLSDSFAQLSGIDLTLACACLTMTCLEISQLDTVQIRAESALLDGMPSVVMDESVLLLLDDYAETTESGGES